MSIEDRTTRFALELTEEANRMCDDGDYEGALKVVNRAVDLQSNNVLPYLCRMSIYAYNNDLEGELGDLHLVIAYYERFEDNSTFLSAMIDRKDKLNSVIETNNFIHGKL